MNLYSICRTSPVSGRSHTMALPMTREQFEEIQPYLVDKRPVRKIQEIVPHLSPDQREFILTGITGEEWEEMFTEEEK